MSCGAAIAKTMARGLCLFLTGCSSPANAPGSANGPATDAGADAATPMDSAADTAVEDSAPPDALTDADADDDAQPPCSPPNPSPGLGPGGYPLDGWTWTRRGVVLEDTSTVAQSGYIAPAALIVDDTLHLWITRKHGTVHRILHSASSDGAAFSSPVETSGLAGQDIVAYPTVLHDGARFLMWYGSGVIDRAESVDGVAWTMIATGVLTPGPSGAFDSLSLLYPNVVAADGGYVMHYTGFDGQAFRIGRAHSLDGTSWTRSPNGAVLEVGAATEFDNHAVAQPCAVAIGARVLLWYGGYDTSVANPGPYRVGLSESLEGVVYERKGVSLDLEPSGVEAWSTRDPAVVRWRGQWWMAYSAMGDDGRYRIAIATSDTCEGGS